MKTTPILYTGEMVRSILAGRKWQTRRVVKLTESGRVKQPGGPKNWHLSDPEAVNACPFCKPGDRLWVRETFYAWGRWETRFSEKKGRDEWHFVDLTLQNGKQYRYAADIGGGSGPRQRGSLAPQWWKRPAIHMPRHASRLTLVITSARVERLTDINERDAYAEGAPNAGIGGCRAGFLNLWGQLYGQEDIERNPLVWVLEFNVVAP